MNEFAAREHAVSILAAAIHAVQPANLLPQYLKVGIREKFIDKESLYNTSGNTYVIGAGKAAAAMALVTEQLLGDHIKEGLVTTKYDHSLATKKIRIIEAAHPVPDQQGVSAVTETIQLLKKVTTNDTVICLISGGASALWCDVPEGITLPEVQRLFDQLIRSGASIAEINTVRKHLSAIKGGQLIRRCNGARVHALIISDVPGDDLSVIASGPTVADHTTFTDACEVLHRYQLWAHLSVAIKQYLEEGRNGQRAETPKPGDPLFKQTSNTIIGSNSMALEAAAAHATAIGYHTEIDPHFVTGNAEEAARQLVQKALAYKGPLPVCLLQGGETTVQVKGKGLGGRNQHFVLAALQAIQGSVDQSRTSKLTILSGGTDGTDGPTDATGAIGDRHTLDRAAEATLNLGTYLADNDAYHFFQRTNSLVITGPTQTNVMDIMMAIIEK
ncbi:DUF4147 domain-containing protein [Paraflavitalea sp. CAU 1676]|uniref:glycerate kinase type-2 family protein n=1 Tax=Paraflavitalea sp. CAU 1676 TaxID=3032598 RepID=UPI0023DCE2D4|nr:DUF4147 domain-containing protein [Paraflavitalea sp. CAU 1676]MDF2187312.1 DUF4147 domain-containing protein [Paraflavitalea sp. CAU 1676]